MAELDQYPAPPHLRAQKGQGPTKSQILAAVTVVPIGAFLLFLAGITFVGTLIGVAVTTPLFILFSPILVPAATTVGLAVTGFLTSGAFGITALSSFSCIVNSVRKMRGHFPHQLEQAKKKAQEMAGQAGQKARDVGHAAQGKVQETTGGRVETTRGLA